MNIVVCIKQVPDTTEIKINPETNTLIREGVESIINPFDLYAIEEALRLKEQYNGSVTIVSMGPPQVEAALREALSLGADTAILLSDRKFAGADTLATSYTLAAAIRKIAHADVLLFGKQAIDGDTAQVGPGVAAHLNIPHIAYVRNIRTVTDTTLVAERLMDDGVDIVEAKLPVLLTVVKDINEPRLPSLRGKMKAKKAEIITWNAEDLNIDEEQAGLNGSPTSVEKIFSPDIKKTTEVLCGETPEDLGKKLAEKITGLCQR